MNKLFQGITIVFILINSLIGLGFLVVAFSGPSDIQIAAGGAIAAVVFNWVIIWLLVLFRLRDNGNKDILIVTDVEGDLSNFNLEEYFKHRANTYD